MYKTIKKQFDNFLQRGGIPIFEIEVLENGNQEYILVNIEVDKSGVCFYSEFDYYVSKYDSCFDNLDHYLEDGYDYIINEICCSNKYELI